MREKIANLIRELHPRLVERRRDFHRHPELGFQEFRTSQIVADWLADLGLEVETRIAVTGVVARLRGARPGPTVGLRADMDALPITDIKTCDYASTEPGKMHACGHDAHTTMLLGAASVLTALREEIEGDIVFIFQPAEEGLGGGARMIEAGVLEGIDFLLGQHVAPIMPAGVVGVAGGPQMAAADEFTLRIIGKSGHGAYPHMAVDAIQIAGQVITALQAIISRTVDAAQTAVLSIGTIQGGTNSNVIADVVEMKGTVRTFDKLLREEIPRKMEAIIGGITAGYGARYELDYKHICPALVNDRSAAALMKRVATDLLGPQRVLEAPPQMSSEDFAFLLEKVPGCFFFTGCKHPAPVHDGYNVHHPGFDIDENGMFFGVQLLVEGALAYLAEHRVAKPQHRELRTLNIQRDQS